MSAAQRPFVAALLVPTGIGAAMGGFAGDAIPIARTIAGICDCLITHPNVLNGAQLYWPLPNTLYVEGYALDRWAAGQWGLQPVHSNRIGLVLDQAIEPDLRLRQLQAADAARATLGLSLTDAWVTDAPLGVTLEAAPSGATWGTVQNPDSLLRAVDQLIHTQGASAIAVVARFPDNPDSDVLARYRQGQGVDPLAGAEAIISHLVVRTFGIPCAHAPAVQPLPLDSQINPRAAAEELGYTFLPSVLVGLARAPQLVREAQLGHHIQSQDIWVDQLDAVVVPATACGSSALLSLSQGQIPIIAVTENTNRMQVRATDLGMACLTARSYLEAIGLLAALKAGVDPAALRPVLQPILSRPASGPSR